MKITFRPMTAAEAWENIIYWHKPFHSRFKKYGYDFKKFIPDHPLMNEMYNIENLTDEQIAKYRTIFINEIYNAHDLRRLDAFMVSDAIPALESAAETLRPFTEKWGTQIPDELEIQTTYGNGAAYNYGPNKKIILEMTSKPRDAIIGTLQHEFIHILIETPIIQKYNVPQDFKERIVDRIGYDFFRINTQPAFRKVFASDYLSPDAIRNDLPGTVQRIMNDYNLLQIQTAKNNSSGIG